MGGKRKPPKYSNLYDIWLPQLLKNRKNRKVSLNEKGKN